jgi:hypothetical protein
MYGTNEFYDFGTVLHMFSTLFCRASSITHMKATEMTLLMVETLEPTEKV